MNFFELGYDSFTEDLNCERAYVKRVRIDSTLCTILFFEIEESVYQIGIVVGEEYLTKDNSTTITGNGNVKHLIWFLNEIKEVISVDSSVRFYAIPSDEKRMKAYRRLERIGFCFDGEKYYY